MKSNELFEEIHAGIIKDNSTIKVMTEEGQVITKIKYENKGLKWEQGKFDTKYLCDIDIEFEVEEPDIDIQKIEPIDLFNPYIETTDKKINELIEAVKQLDRKVNRREEDKNERKM